MMPHLTLRPELAACFAVRHASPAPAPAAPPRPAGGVLRELERYRRPR